MSEQQPVNLTGDKPLWDHPRKYLEFVLRHNLDIWLHSLSGDENANLLVDLIIVLGGKEPTEIEYSALMVVTERYIHDHFPDIAHIVGGYPKDARQQREGGEG